MSEYGIPSPSKTDGRTDLFFETYPISFIQERGWSAGVGGLPFIAVMVGVLCGGCINYFFVKTRYVRILRQKGRVPPEERLVPMMVGSVALPAGLFLYAWTSSPSITPWPQIAAGVPVGAGMILRQPAQQTTANPSQALCSFSCKASTTYVCQTTESDRAMC